jgi:REP element-mobilizing transposase RayT
MGRHQRIETPDGFYHLHTRGNAGRPIYFGNWSGRLFVRELTRASLRHGWRVLAYCLMVNHYHLVVQIRDDLSNAMCEFNGRFARATNRINDCTDHVFGQRFVDHLIGDEAYLLTSCRYVLLNPVRKYGNDPIAWRWSSYRATLGLAHSPGCLDVGFVLEQFGGRPNEARRRFRAFVDDGRRAEGPPIPPAENSRPRGGIAATARG